MLPGNTTEPDPLNETMVTSGPFNISAYVPGEYLEIITKLNLEDEIKKIKAKNKDPGDENAKV